MCVWGLAKGLNSKSRALEERKNNETSNVIVNTAF